MAVIRSIRERSNSAALRAIRMSQWMIGRQHYHLSTQLLNNITHVQRLTEDLSSGHQVPDLEHRQAMMLRATAVARRHLRLLAVSGETAQDVHGYLREMHALAAMLRPAG